MPGIRKLLVALAVCALALAGTGCGYSLRPPYNQTIRTVYVPMLKSYRFRRDINIQLTKMLVDEINLRTPYVVVGDPDKADARLEGVITFDDKNVTVENPQNLPRQIMTSLTVNVTFTDNRTGRVKDRAFPEAYVNEFTQFYPEIGESSMVGFHKVMEKIVRDIVNMMEDPWGPEYLLRDDPALSRDEPEEDESDDRELATEPPPARIVRDPEALRPARQ